jgi:hypothetical protein
MNTISSMSRIAPAVVYVGPTISKNEISRMLPGADVRPPMRRGDLHRDRQLHYPLFIIIDGVFFNDEAVSPREVIDIIQDGAVVIGAASLGALRAAELGQIGMLGCGLIYRLFRRGVLIDEDEVAVLFKQDLPYPSLTTALVDIRWSLRIAIRSGHITKAEAQTYLERARSLPFTERSWKSLKCSAPFYSLKKLDALLLCREVRRLLDSDPSILHRPRLKCIPFPDHQELREDDGDLLAGIDMDKENIAVRQWLKVICNQVITTTDFDVEVNSSLLMRYRAFRDGIAMARSQGLQPQIKHRLAAESQIVKAHRAIDWPDLCKDTIVPMAELDKLCYELSLVKCLREVLFASKYPDSSINEP